MNAAQAVEFLRRLGCQKISTGASWVRATCPFGRWRHALGKDEVPSFAISIHDDSPSYCRCQAGGCEVNGSLIYMLWILDRYGVNRHDLVPFLLKYNQHSAVGDDDPPTGLRAKLDRVKNYGHWSPPAEPKPQTDPVQSEVPEVVLEQMRAWMTGEVMEFLTVDRGLTDNAVATWELGWMPSQMRVCIPIRNFEGKLVSVSGRLLRRDEQGRLTDRIPKDLRLPRYLHSEFRRNLVLYGMDKTTASDTAFLFEGFFQAIATWQCGFDNTFARMGTHLSKEQIEFLGRFSTIVVVPDGDEAGRASASKILGQLEGRGFERVVVSDMPEGKDADQLSSDLLREILQTALTT